MAASTLEPGVPAPPFSLPGDDEATHSLEDFRGQWLVWYAYPKDDTPGCTLEAQEFRDALPTLTGLGVRVVGVSPDSVASHCQFRDKHQLTFRLLADEGKQVLEAYGAWGEKNMYGKVSLGVIRTTVIIDPEGIVRKVFPRVRAKGHVEKVVEALRLLTASGASERSSSQASASAKKAPAKAASKTQAQATRKH